MPHTFNIAICDDSEAFVWSIYSTVQKIMDKHNFKYTLQDFTKGKDLIAASREKQLDIILLDIDMPDISGFEAVEKLRERQKSAAIIFITSHSEMAYQAYDYHPYQFVDKTDLLKLEMVLPSLCNKIIQSKLVESSVVIDVNGIFEVAVNAVMYIKANKNYVLFCYSDGTEKEYRAKIKDVYEALKGKGFIYIQRSYIVNCRFIYDFDTKEVTLKNNETISVTRDYEMRSEAQKNYGEFLRRLRW